MMSFLKRMYGNFQSREEVFKFVVLGFIFFLVIGTYWTLRPLKDGLFLSIVGGIYQPYAKILSMFAVFPIVMFYSKLIDWFSRDKVFYILTAFYCVTAFAFALAFMNPTIGLANTVESPSRILGWLWYVWVESFGSLIVALFWAYTADITAPDVAKRGYPLIVLFGQLGNILGPLFLTPLGKNFFNGDSSPVVAITGVLIFCIGFMVWIFGRIVPASQRQGYKSADEAKVDKKEKGEAGFFEGLFLLLRTPYLLSIFFIITIFEMIVTVFDFLLKINVAENFATSAERVAYLGSYAWMTGLVAFLCVILGINNIQRKVGMTASLLILPFLVLFAVLTSKFYTGLAVFFWIMVFAKAVNYALNQPTLKQLYIPTSADAKYKSQAWIEMFGSRGSKGTGSFFNTFREGFIKMSGPAGAAAFMTIFTFGGVGLITLWVPIAIYASRKYNTAVKENKVVC
ncbi:hypothetical protein HOM50_02555 [bacterium]|jgi:ATP:ADP antiporter, AAA family|nr:hypothetical protein [bacterium]MBT5015264.1 hypothetical protein [bacterium]